VCVISLFNGLGRLFWGALSDRLGRPRTFLALFLLQTAAFAALPYRTALTLIAGMLAVAAPLPLLFNVLVQRSAQLSFPSSREATAWRASGS
jgi:nitrate/nitrite transporter NarK